VQKQVLKVAKTWTVCCVGSCDSHLSERWVAFLRLAMKEVQLVVCCSHARGTFPVEGAVWKLHWTLDSAKNRRLRNMTRNLYIPQVNTGALLFNAGCNEQVLSPKPWKKFWRRSVLSFEKHAKTHL